ncbi:MAG: ATP-binding cassette domain-containing protein [Thermoleophilia bacterium]
MSAPLVPHDTSPAPAVRMLGITKRFGPVTACDGVDFVLGGGEIHCLLGENGAGKTTLMSILFGLVPPDDGQIVLDGRSVQLASPRDALRHGIGMVHQHFMLVPEFTVAENVVLGSRAAWTPRFDRARAEEEVREVARSSGLDVDPRALVRDIPVDVQQRVEILKLLHRGAKVLILDEPTASLGPAGIRSLFEGLATLRERGHSAILITHKLTEVTAVADGVTVLRAGRLQGTFRRGQYAEAELARAMTGGDIAALPVRRAASGGDVVLRVRGLTVADPVTGRNAVEDLDLEVAAGEIVGIAGVEGNGQRELADALAGVVAPAAGTIELAGADITPLPPRDRHAQGLGVIPEDRLRWGLVADSPWPRTSPCRTSPAAACAGAGNCWTWTACTSGRRRCSRRTRCGPRTPARGPPSSPAATSRRS